MKPIVAAKCGISIAPISKGATDALYRWRTDMNEVHIWNGERNFIDESTFEVEVDEMRRRCDEAVMIVRNDEPEPVGFAYAEGIRSTRRSCSVGMFVDPRHRGHFVGPVAFGLLANHLFHAHSVGKINVAVAGWNTPMLTLADRLGYLRKEGCQIDELLLDGKSFDYHLFALDRHSFETMQASALWKRYVG